MPTSKMSRFERRCASLLAAGALGLSAVAMASPPAYAFGIVGCAGWSDEPSNNPGHYIGIAARMQCVGKEVGKTSLYRVRAKLRSEDVRPGIIPNKWTTVHTSRWSNSVVKPNTAGIIDIVHCSDVDTEDGWKTRGEGELRDLRAHGDSDEVNDFC